MLPDCLHRDELPKGNALVEAATFIAILVGTILGGVAMEEGRDPAYLALGMIGFAILSYASAWFIPPTPRADSALKIDVNIARSTFAFLAELYREPKLWRLGLVTSIFWLLGAVGTSLLPALVAQTMHGAQSVATVHLAVFAVSIGLGSGLAGFLSHGQIVLLPSVMGAAGVAFAAADLALMLALRAPPSGASLLALGPYFAQPGAWRALIDLALMSVSGGMIVVPVLRRAAGLFRPRAPRAHHCGGQRAQRRRDGRRRSSGRGAASLWRADLGALWRPRALRRRSRLSGSTRPSSKIRCATCCRSSSAPSIGSRSRASRTSTAPAPIRSSRSTM